MFRDNPNHFHARIKLVDWLNSRNISQIPLKQKFHFKTMRGISVIYIFVVLVLGIIVVQSAPHHRNMRDVESALAQELTSIEKETSLDFLRMKSERFLSGYCVKTRCSSSVGIVPESGCKVNWRVSSGNCDGFVKRSSCSSRWIKVRTGCTGVYDCRTNRYVIYGAIHCYYKAGLRRKQHCYKC